MILHTSLGIVSGVLLVLSLPKPDLYYLAWVALVPWLLAITWSKTTAQATLTSYISGFVFFSGAFYWITETMIVYGGLSATTSFSVGLLFSLVYALFFAVFGATLFVFIQKVGPRGLFLAAPLWVTLELIRTYVIFGGFPWMLSGYALVPFTGILQIVTWTGIYGLSFLATFVNSVLAFAALQRSKAAGAVGIAAILIAWFLPVIGETPSGEPLDVRIVQTNIALDQPWQRPAGDALLDELHTLSTGKTSTPKLIVWPENPAPFYLSDDDAFRARAERIARDSGSYFLVGHIGEIGESPSNSAALIDPSGKIVSRYDKMLLVPFGEFVPFKDLLFFAEALVAEVGDFVPGTQYTLSSIDNHRVSTAICYESIFPAQVREFVKRGSELIVVITNDGWFGESSAPFQHLRMGVVRAVENRRYIVRSANTGISAIIDPYGRIESRTELGVRTILEGTVRYRNDQTFYTQYGDVFAYLNVVAVLAAAGVVRVKWRFRKGEAYVRRVN